MTDNQILTNAVQNFGIISQKTKAIEEMGELLVAMSRESIGRASELDICEEIADVMIMMKQLAIIYGKSDVSTKYSQKIARLEDILNSM